MAEESKTSGSGQKKTLIRGADGALYLLSDSDLAPFRVEDTKSESVTRILKDAEHNPKVKELPRDVVKEIQHVEGCIAHHASVDVYIND